MILLVVTHPIITVITVTALQISIYHQIQNHEKKSAEIVIIAMKQNRSSAKNVAKNWNN